MPRTRNLPLLPGQRRRQAMLGTESVYDVLAIEGDLVRVSVVSAPGLAAGTALALTREAVDAMELLGPPAGRAEDPAAKLRADS